MAGLIIKDKSMYTIADQRYYETLSRYNCNTEDFTAGLQRRLPSGWHLTRSEIWTNCSHEDALHPDQGWKIHLSATPAYAPAILTTVARILFAESVPFKFVSDRMLLFLQLSKRWPRGGSGKFMAVYPSSEQQCGHLLETLHKATVGYNGAYILSDRRYKDSKIVHYRYGGLTGVREYQPDGTYTLKIKNANDEYVDDERNPFFDLQEGMADPFQGAVASDEADANGDGTLHNGRYEIVKALTHSVSGGVYKGIDLSNGREVVIKEARPFTNLSPLGLDAVQSLKKEFRVLAEVADEGFSPRPLDFFFDWEHAFLVEEYLPHMQDFRGYFNRLMIALRTSPTQEESQSFIEVYCKVFDQLITAILALHERNIVFGDLSMANILIAETEDGPIVKLIDFEGSHELNVDVPSHVFTVGFSAMIEDKRGTSNQSDDYYAIGSLMLAGLFPMNQILAIDKLAVGRWLEALSRDFAVPSVIRSAILGFVARTVSTPGVIRLRDALRRGFIVPPPTLSAGPPDLQSLDRRVADIAEYICYSADTSRKDRLFPADPEVFQTNPMSVSNGAAGVAAALNRVLGHVPAEFLTWMHQHTLATDRYPPGLYNGLSGIAWAWLETGDEERALHALRLADTSPLLGRSPDMYNGLAGWGMTHLRFHRHFNDGSHSDKALDAGARVIAMREEVDSESCRWTSGGDVCAGYGHGTAGVCSFLLELHTLTGDPSYLRHAVEGLNWVQSVAIDNSNSGMSWRANEEIPSVVPYLRWGSAGIVPVLIKAQDRLGDNRYDREIVGGLMDCSRKYAIFPGIGFGLAGIADMLIDIADDHRWSAEVASALERVIAGLDLFAISTDHGVAYPGDGLGRISCDFGTGSAGIMYALHRYATKQAPLFRL